MINNTNIINALLKVEKDIGKTILLDSIIEIRLKKPQSILIKTRNKEQIVINKVSLDVPEDFPDIISIESDELLFLCHLIKDQVANFEVKYNNIFISGLPLFSRKNLVKENRFIPDLAIEVEKDNSIAFIKQLFKESKLIKKTLFEESQFLYINLKKNNINRLTEFDLEESEIDCIISDSIQKSIILSKNNIKVLNTLFGKDKVRISLSDKEFLFENNDYSYRFVKPDLNEKLYHIKEAQY